MQLATHFAAISPAFWYI